MNGEIQRRSRAWPVDPQQYPLSGPSKGPVYVPSTALGRTTCIAAAGLVIFVFLAGSAVLFGAVAVILKHYL